MHESPAQTAIMDVALNAENAEQIEYLAIVAESARRFGNLLQPRQVRALGQIAELRERYAAEVRVPGSGEDFNQQLELAGRVVDGRIEADSSLVAS